MSTKKFCPYCMTPMLEGEPCPACGLTEGNYSPFPYHLPPGTILMERYLIGRVLGEGGFGITYIGCDLRLEMKVAVKEYFPLERVIRMSSVSLEVTRLSNVSEDAYQHSKEKFLREARVMARMVKQPEIVSVRDYFEANNTAYIVMEYIEGTTLNALVEQRGGRIPAGELLHMMEPLFGALQELHDSGLLHRDISPENIMLENGNIRLLDFGCAQDEVTGNKTLTISLKHGYAPVEQYQSKGQGPWTDVYALAATIYFCLTGKYPPQAMDRLTEDELILPRRLGVNLTEKQESALSYGMGLHPERRFRSMQEFHAALYEKIDWETKTEAENPESDETENGSEDHSLEPESIVQTPGKFAWLAAHRTLVLAGTAAVLILIGVSVGVVISRQSGQNPSVQNASDSIAASKEDTSAQEIAKADSTQVTEAPVGQNTEAVTEMSAAQTTEVTEEPLSEQAAEDTDVVRRQELEAMFADAQTFNGGMENWEDFVTVLEDDGISAVIIPAGTELRLGSAVTITKPVLVESGAFFGLPDSLTLDGENACLYVRGECRPLCLLRTMNGGRIAVDDGGVLSAHGGIWLENSEDMESLGGDLSVTEDQIFVLNLQEIFAQSAEVSTEEEFKAALNDESVNSITVTGDITVDADGEYNYDVSIPVLVNEEASLTVTGTSSEYGDGNTIYLNTEAILINYGTLNAYLNCDGDLIYNGGSWTGGMSANGTLVQNQGNMTMGDDRESWSNFDTGSLFLNEGTLFMQDTTWDLYEGIFYNRGTITVSEESRLYLGSGLTAQNRGEIYIEDSANLSTAGSLTNQGEIVLEDSSALKNDGLILLTAGSTLDQQGGEVYNDDALILMVGNPVLNLTTQPGGTIVEPLSQGGEDGCVLVQSGEELLNAMEDSSAQSVILSGNVDIDGDLTVTKPMELQGILNVSGTLTLADGYLIQGGSALRAAEIVLGEDTFFVQNCNLFVDSLTVGSGAAFYSASEKSQGYEIVLGNITVAGDGLVRFLASLTLNGASIQIQTGGQLLSEGWLWMNGCSVEIASEGYLRLFRFEIDEDTVITNNRWLETIDCTIFPENSWMAGTLINSGKIYGNMGVAGTGTVENNGHIYQKSEGSVVTQGNGKICGNAVETWDSEDDWKTK